MSAYKYLKHKYTKLLPKTSTEKNINLNGSKQLYVMTICKLTDITISTKYCFFNYIKRKWNAHVKSMLWIAQKHLNAQYKDQANFIKLLTKIKIGTECKQSDIDKLSTFIVQVCECTNEKVQTYDTICKTRFLEAVCLEMLECYRAGNKIKSGNIEIIDCTIHVMRSNDRNISSIGSISGKNSIINPAHNKDNYIIS